MADLVTGTELAAALGLPYAPPYDTALDQVAATAHHTLLNVLTTVDTAGDPIDHTVHAWDKEAALAVAQQVWASRQAPGGQLIGTDLGPVQTPHLIGPQLLTRVQGIVKPNGCWAGGGMVG